MSLRKYFNRFGVALAFLLAGIMADVVLYFTVGSPFGVSAWMLTGAIAGTEGSDAMGSQYKELGPATVYFGKKTTAALSGTVSASGSATLTGASTKFLTELSQGCYVLIGTATTPRKVITIASDTSLVLDQAVTASAVSIYKADMMDLGYNDAVSIKYGLTKSGLKSAQEGTNDADAAVTGYKCEIEFGLVSATPERKAKIFQGWKLNLDAVTAKIKGQAFTFPIGQLDSSIWSELRIVRWRDGAESSDPMDTILITRAAPVADGEGKFDSSTQIIFKTMFKGYVDSTVLFGGKPVIMSMGDLT